MRRFIVIENFFPNCKKKVYARFQESGRMLPEGLVYIDSWLEKNGDRCFQLMETDDSTLFDVWIRNWEDLGSFEIIEIGDNPIGDG